jgi:hypothetical protein
MKPLLLTTALLLSLFITSFGQNVGFNDNNSDPNASAMVDVYSSSKGMLIPRVSLDSTLLATPVTNPATSLMVYNTATVHDVRPGYYYWNGSLWNRLETSADNEINYSLVTKNSNCTLLKTETMVLVSGNTIITLPTVTPDDNGLEIVVKNIGTYTDLAVVKPQAGKKIDASDSSRLTRWQGKVYLAYNTNWIVKQKEPRADNLLDISETGSFTTIEQAVEFLNLHMSDPTVVRLGGGTFSLSSTINIDLPYPVTFQGLSFGETILDCPSGDTAFCAMSECYFKMLTFQASSGGIGVHIGGTDTYNEIKDCFFNDFAKGILMTNSAELWLFETDFYNCTTAGIEVDAGPSNNTIFRGSECDFYNCANGVNLKSAGPSTEISLLNGTFYNQNSGQIGIAYVPSTGSDNFRFTSMIIQNNSFNTVGNFFSGFDFSRLDGRDAKVFMENNAGVPAERPHIHLNVLNNSTNTTLTTANTFYKAAIVNTSQTVNTTKWDAATDTTNRIRYLPVNVRDAVVFISGNISNKSLNGRVANIAIVKNGVGSTPMGTTTVYLAVKDQSYPFSTVVYVENIHRNDYLELWVSSPTSSDIIKIDDLNWYTDTH